MSYLNGAKLIKVKMDSNQDTVNMVNDAGGIKTTISQSDKFGFDWKNYYVNNVIVRQDYIEQTVIKGTFDNPLEWGESVAMVPNAHYIHGGVIKVWMGKFCESAEWDHADFVDV